MTDEPAGCSRMWLLLPGLMALAVVPAEAQTARATLRVTVVDQTDAVIVGASVSITVRPGKVPVVPLVTSTRGEVEFNVPASSLCTVEVAAPGFSRGIADVAVATGVTDVRVRLEIAGLVEEVTVTPSAPQGAGTRAGTAFKRVLRGQDLAALPDDPEAFREALQQIAGPGAVFRVDGFSGTRLPPKSQIEEVRFAFSDLSAEHHSYVTSIVDILTKPGGDSLRASVMVRLRPSRLNANAPLSRARSESDQYDLEAMVGAPLWREHTSILAAASLTDQRTPQPIVALTPSGPLSGTVQREDIQSSLWMSAAQALGKGHSLRGRWYERRSRSTNSGVGGQALPERAVNATLRERTVQLSYRGSPSPGLSAQLRFERAVAQSTVEATSDTPGLVVPGAFDGGGAQVGGTQREAVWMVAGDVDLVGLHQAFRFGADLERMRLHSDRWQNRDGTYVFATLQDYLASRPHLFTRRIGDPSVNLNSWRNGVYVRDEVQLPGNVTLSAGTRVEGQSAVAGTWHFAPRASASWAPLSGTSFRLGVGRYLDWVPSEIEEQVARVDGVRQQEVVVFDPPYPYDDVGSTSRVVYALRDRYELDPSVRMPRYRRLMVAVEQTIGRGSIRAVIQDVRGSGLLRGVNAGRTREAAGSSDLGPANVIQAQSVGKSRERSLQVNVTVPKIVFNTSVGAAYTLASIIDNTAGAFIPPADPSHPELELGPASGDVRHRASASVITRLGATLLLAVNILASSGAPYSKLTGRDDNGDGLLTDRPSGSTRNSERGQGQVQVAARSVWVRRLGRAHSETNARADDRSGQIELSCSVQNLFNRTNPTGYVGVVTSPLFGEPVTALPGRRVSLGVTYRFR